MKKQKDVRIMIFDGPPPPPPGRAVILPPTPKEVTDDTVMATIDCLFSDLLLLPLITLLGKDNSFY